MPEKTYNFKHDLFEPKKLTRVEENGKRLYVTEDGEKYPSVTTVLSYLSKRKIQQWRNNVGHEQANQISTQASRAGTAMHNVAEKFVLNDETWINENPISVDLFMTIQPYLKNVNLIRGVELQMYSSELKTAGTADLVCEYKNRNTILDFKTSRREKTKNNIMSYFMQCCAYGIMAEEHYEFKVEQIVILMSVSDGTALVFEEDAEPYMRMTRKFFQLYNEGKLT